MAKLRRGIRIRLVPLIVRVFALTCAVLPWSVAQGLGRGLGRLAWCCCRRERQWILEHLAIAYPDWSREKRLLVGRACLRHLGMSVAELLHLHLRPCSTVADHLSVEGGDDFRQLLNAGRPILIVSGHCGNWELIAAACQSMEIPLVAVARDLKDSFIQKLIVEVRERYQCQTLVRGCDSSATQFLRTLRRSGVLAMLIDQDIRAEGVFVPFFGRPAFTPVGAAKLAQRLNAVVVPVFAERRQCGSHLVRFEPPLQVSSDLEIATAMMTERIEMQIKSQPEQWVWLHRRWQTQPPVS